MKKLFKVALVAGCMLFLGNFANAQTKIGYINSNDLIGALPELKTVQTQMDAYQKTWMDKITGLETEFTNKNKDYQAKQATMTDADKTAAQGELSDLSKRYQDLQTQAKQQVDGKSQELMKPLLDKTKAAINDVAKEKGYTYVFDTTATGILVMPPGDDLLPAVKLKLGIK
jgi:outer membrane protein